MTVLMKRRLDTPCGVSSRISSAITLTREGLAQLTRHSRRCGSAENAGTLAGQVDTETHTCARLHSDVRRLFISGVLAMWREGCLSPARFGMSPTTIFAPASTPAGAIFGLATLVIGVTALIFVCVSALIGYAVFRFRKRPDDDGSEPPQVYGSNQLELAWTVIPILIVVVLFLASARVITFVQNAERPADSIQVVAVGHQF